MPRTRRTWTDLLAEIRLLLRESDPNISFWTDPELLNLFNQERDLLEMGHSQAHEGHNVLTYTTAVVTDQTHYQLPAFTNRVRRILLVYPDNHETPLIRSEDYTEITAGDVGDLNSQPTYRIIGEHIVLNPSISTAQADSVKVEIETASNRITAGSDTAIPADWPLFAETLLVLSTAIAAFDVEGSQGSLPQGVHSSMVRRRDSYISIWLEYIETRSWGRHYSTPFVQAD